MLKLSLLKVSIIYIEKFKTRTYNFASRADSHSFGLFDYKLLKQCNLKTIQYYSMTLSISFIAQFYTKAEVS